MSYPSPTQDRAATHAMATLVAQQTQNALEAARQTQAAALAAAQATGTALARPTETTTPTSTLTATLPPSPTAVSTPTSSGDGPSALAQFVAWLFIGVMTAGVVFVFTYRIASGAWLRWRCWKWARLIVDTEVGTGADHDVAITGVTEAQRAENARRSRRAWKLQSFIFLLWYDYKIDGKPTRCNIRDMLAHAGMTRKGWETMVLFLSAMGFLVKEGDYPNAPYVLALDEAGELLTLETIYNSARWLASFTPPTPLPPPAAWPPISLSHHDTRHSTAHNTRTQHTQHTAESPAPARAAPLAVRPTPMIVLPARNRRRRNV